MLNEFVRHINARLCFIVSVVGRCILPC